MATASYRHFPHAKSANVTSRTKATSSWSASTVRLAWREGRPPTSAADAPRRADADPDAGADAPDHRWISTRAMPAWCCSIP